MTAPQSTPLPEAPSRGEAESEFITKANTFVAALEPFRQDLQEQADFVDDRVDEQTTLIQDAVDDVVADIMSDLTDAVDEAEASATAAAKDAVKASDQAAIATSEASDSADSAFTAVQAAQTALATGNYQGQWSTLTGAYSKGISVEYNSIFWALRSDTSDITSIVPGVSAEWVAINGAELGTAAFENIGTNIGDVKEVTPGNLQTGGFQTIPNVSDWTSLFDSGQPAGFSYTAQNSEAVNYGGGSFQSQSSGATLRETAIFQGALANRVFFGHLSGTGNTPTLNEGWTKSVAGSAGNTVVDGSGFIKEASPIVKLYSDKIECNDYKEIEDCTFERIDTGHYIIKGAPLFSRDGWYIETLKDRNNNIYFTLDYEELEDGLHIKTYEPDYSTGRATNGAPVDINEGRFVTLRFEEDASLYPTPEEPEA